MTNEYNTLDIISALEFGKRNPNSKMEDWLEMRSRTLTPEEEKLYKGMQYAKSEINVKGHAYEMILIRMMHSHELLDNITVKIAGNSGYYRLDPLPGDWHPPIHSILCLDAKLGELDDWEELEDFKGVKTIGNDKMFLTYDLDCEGWDDLDFARWDRWTNNLEIDNLALWHHDSRMMAYIDKIAEFDFKPIKELFAHE